MELIDFVNEEFGIEVLNQKRKEKEEVNAVIHGDSLEVLREMESESIHAVVCDPPYALGFMGKEWDSFTPKEYQDFCYEWSKECFRVLKTGGYLLAFSGTRTYHRLATGIEDSGFEVRDMLEWFYGSGFPKSYDISKGLDKHFGEDRESLGVKHTPSGSPYNKENWNDDKHNTNFKRSRGKITRPITEEAKLWEGYGTCLTPAHEPIVLAQKPRDGTFVNNVLEHEVGGLWIDGCRIMFNPDKETDNRITNEEKNYCIGKHYEDSSYVKYAPDGKGRKMYKTKKGRFPSNLLFTHHPKCKLIGTKKVGSGEVKKNSEIERTQEDTFFTGKKLNDTDSIADYGEEEIPEYECHPNCPIGKLDFQSGECQTGDIKPYKRTPKNPNVFHKKDKRKEVNYYHKGDKGGASRFFYCSKAHKKERNAGCKDLYWEIKGDSLGRISKKKYEKLPKDNRAKFNPVSTLKPINVMRWLVRLVKAPKDAIILDPFAGSGTTAIACIIEGINYIAIEKREAFAKTIIPKRLKFWKDYRNWDVLKDHNALPQIEDLQLKKQYGDNLNEVKEKKQESMEAFF
jgi:DNA modification methylase